MISNWTRESEKLRFPIQLVSRIHASEILESSAAYSYEYHTQQHDTRHNPTPQHRRHWLGCRHVCCCSSRVSVIHPYLRPSAARDSTRWPQCAVSTTFANCCAGCSFGNSGRSPAPRWPRGRDGENAPRLKLTRCSRNKRDISIYSYVCVCVCSSH